MHSGVGSVTWRADSWNGHLHDGEEEKCEEAKDLEETQPELRLTEGLNTEELEPEESKLHGRLAIGYQVLSR